MNIFEKYPNSKFLNGLPEDSDLFPLRERVIELFRFLDGLEDPHFEEGLNYDPHARLWEMMLAKILKSEGYEPTSADHGPDFVVEKNGKRIFVEAVCPGLGAEGNPNSVPPTVYGARQRWPEAEALLRTEREMVITRVCRPVAKLVRFTAPKKPRKRFDPVAHGKWQHKLSGGRVSRWSDRALAAARADRPLRSDRTNSSVGIDQVIANGQVVDGGRHTGVLAGRALRRGRAST